MMELFSWIFANPELITGGGIGLLAVGALVKIAHTLVDRFLVAQSELVVETQKLRAECQRLRLRVWALERVIKDAGLPLPPPMEDTES